MWKEQEEDEVELSAEALAAVENFIEYVQETYTDQEIVELNKRLEYPSQTFSGPALIVVVIILELAGLSTIPEIILHFAP